MTQMDFSSIIKNFVLKKYFTGFKLIKIESIVGKKLVEFLFVCAIELVKNKLYMY